MAIAGVPPPPPRPPHRRHSERLALLLPVVRLFFAVRGVSRRNLLISQPLSISLFSSFLLDPFSTAVPIGGQTILIPSDMSPKRDWGPKRVNRDRESLAVARRVSTGTLASWILWGVKYRLHFRRGKRHSLSWLNRPVFGCPFGLLS